MNARTQLTLPLAPDRSGAPRRWYAIVQRGKVIALVATERTATAAIPNTLAKMYGNGAVALVMGVSVLPPDEERVMRAVNPEPLRAIPESFDIDLLDTHRNGTKVDAYPFANDYGSRWNGSGFTREFIK